MWSSMMHWLQRIVVAEVPAIQGKIRQANGYNG
jgi:hypothetical protein